MKKYLTNIVLFMCSIIITAFLFGCDSRVDNDYVSAADFIDGERLSIPLKVKKASSDGSETTFYHTDNLSELQNIVNALKTDNINISSKIYSDEYLLIEKTENNKTRYYMFKDLSNTQFSINNKDNYLFFGLTGKVYLGNYKSSENLLIAYHLISDERISSDIFNYIHSEGLILNEPYQINGCIDDFYNFYNKIEKFNLIKNEKELIVENINLYNNLIITFTEIEDKAYASFSVSNINNEI